MDINTLTIVLSVVFVVACYGFAHVIFDVVTDFILLAHGNKRNVSFTRAMWLGPVSFAYIMGYMFIN